MPPLFSLSCQPIIHPAISLSSFLYLKNVLREIPASRHVSSFVSVPPKSLLRFLIKSLASFDFFVSRCCPCVSPICLPFSLAVSIPSFVRWRRSATSFSACANARRICSRASSIKYLFTPSSIRSTLVPVKRIPLDTGQGQGLQSSSTSRN